MKIISDLDIKNLESLGKLSNKSILSWVKEAFLLKKDSMLPPKINQSFNNNENFYNTMPAIMPMIDVAGVKMVSRYSNRSPSIQADLLLYSLGEGKLLTLMDATWITTKRTGAVAALAIETLSKSNYETIAIVGLGESGKACLEMLLTNPSNASKTFKLMKYKDHTNKVSEFLYDNGVKNVIICDTHEELIKESDVIVSAVTVAKDNFGADGWYESGVLVVPIHTRGFQNCDLFFDKVFADDARHVHKFKYFNNFKQFNEIDKVLRGDIKGRELDGERILSYNIGIALHDIYIAKKILDFTHSLRERVRNKSFTYRR